jgi:hypothetical protein
MEVDERHHAIAIPFAQDVAEPRLIDHAETAIDGRTGATGRLNRELAVDDETLSVGRGRL